MSLKWTQSSRYHLHGAEQKGTITSLNLLITPRQDATGPLSQGHAAGPSKFPWVNSLLESCFADSWPPAATGAELLLSRFRTLHFPWFTFSVEIPAGHILQPDKGPAT